jgi:hypothetical protein
LVVVVVVVVVFFFFFSRRFFSLSPFMSARREDRIMARDVPADMRRAHITSRIPTQWSTARLHDTSSQHTAVKGSSISCIGKKSEKI